jgi:hypothetical protein
MAVPSTTPDAPISPLVTSTPPNIPPTSIRMKNRRKRYLDLTPSYFNSSLELADPLLYDRLIRRFQTAAEREAEGKSKGYSGILHTDLIRSEARLEALKNPNPHALFSYRRGPDGEILEEEKSEVPMTKEEGFERWTYEMTMRFLRGDDWDFEYATVDESEEWDDKAEEDREKLDEYLEGEEPSFVLDGGQPEGETGIQDF